MTIFSNPIMHGMWYACALMRKENIYEGIIFEESNRSYSGRIAEAQCRYYCGADAVGICPAACRKDLRMEIQSQTQVITTNPQRAHCRALWVFQ